MKKIFLSIVLMAVCALAQTTAPVYDDATTCNTDGVTLDPGIYEPKGACAQSGYVCKVASEASGQVSFWLGTDKSCKVMHTTGFTTYYSKVDMPDEIDMSHPNHELRLNLYPGANGMDAFAVAIMSSQILTAKADEAEVWVIYDFVPGVNGANLNSVRLLSFSRL